MALLTPICCLVFHGAQSIVHVDFHGNRDQRSDFDSTEGGGAMEGTMVIVRRTMIDDDTHRCVCF